ncbi:MAG: lipid A deacylase LpxR family protein [Desulfobacteraceae bacterium]|nr:MAG: lipid A deacylase LpxR family protein [Desulfobacteraceae bacterium]
MHFRAQGTKSVFCPISEESTFLYIAQACSYIFTRAFLSIFTDWTPPMQNTLPWQWWAWDTASLQLVKNLVFRMALFCCTVFLPALDPALAKDRYPDHPNSITLYWENDVFARTDRDYTNGLRLTWSRPLRFAGEPLAPHSLLNYPLIRRLPFVKDTRANLGYSVSLGQSIYTPRDTEREDLISDDRPYAGYLYVGLGFHAFRSARLTLLELDIGVVGPWALGEQMQNTAHRLVGSDIAEGWDNQLKNEPAIELVYETKWRLWEQEAANGFGLGLIPHIGGRLGNVSIDADAGAEFRFGWNLPDNFGSCPIRSSCDSNHLADLTPGFGKNRSALGIHLFVGLQGYIVVRDIFLDGNTFRSGHSVDKKPLVAEATTGIALHYKRFRIIYSYVWRSKQFDQQEDAQVFGSFSVSFDY